MIIPGNLSKGFQLRDFAKMFSLMSYGLFFIIFFSIAKSAIFQFPVGLNLLRILHPVVMSVTIIIWLQDTVHKL